MSKENNNIELFSEEDNMKYQKLSSHLNNQFTNFKSKRTPKEQDWIRYQMQYDGKYEHKILSKIKSGKSRHYNRITTAKVDQLKSRCTELVLPNGDKNFALYPTPYPNLPIKVVNETLNLLKSQALQNKETLTNQDIETAIMQVAKKRAERMEATCFDQLLESGYTEIISNVILSGIIYGTGVSKGPFNKQEKISSYKEDEYGNWNAEVKTVEKPYFEHVRVWDFFPDLDAKRFGEDIGAYFYHTFTKGELSKLSKRSDFMGNNIKEYIKSNPKGNYKVEGYESQLINEGNETQSPTLQNKYRLIEYWGAVDCELVKDIFPNLDEDLSQIEVNVWMIDNIIIKCIINPFDSGKRPYHIFNYKKTDSMLLGNGLCELLEEYQRAINAVSRAIHNNMAYVAEPIFEIDDNLVSPGFNITEITPGMVIKREGPMEASSAPALRTLAIQNHIGELRQLEADYRQRMDDISNLQQIMQGDMTGQATLGRTSSGISQLMGAANITLREFARNFDFYNEQPLSLLIEWNIMFNDDENTKGDYQVYPRVSTSLVEKELTANKLNNLVATITPQEGQFLDYEKMLDARLRANNLDPDLLKLSDKQIAQNQQQQAQASQQQQQAMMQSQQLQDANVQADINLKNSKAQSDGEKSKIMSDKVDLERIKTLHGVENDRATQSLNQNELMHNIINEDQARNLNGKDIKDVVGKINGLNPNLNV